MEQDNNSKIYKTGLALAVLLLIAVLFFFYKNNQKYISLQNAFQEEKIELQSELDEIIEDYNDAIADKTTLSTRLEMELNKIVQLRDSVKNLKASNYNAIRKYKKKIARLLKENRGLFLKVDSLSTLNYDLQKENVSIRKALLSQDSINTALADSNATLTTYKEGLEGKVKKAGILKTSPISFIAMKERSNGKLVSTARSSRTDAFRINFNLLENEFATSGRRPVYIQILDAKNNVVAAKSTTNLKNGTEISYTETIAADYQNQKLGIITLIKVNRDLIHKGAYTVNAFVDGLLAGSGSLKLR